MKHLIPLLLLGAWSSLSALELVTRTSAGEQFGTFSYLESISGDGNLVSFVTNESVVPEDDNGVVDIYVKNLTTNQIALVSCNESGEVGDAMSGIHTISRDGEWIVFKSSAGNLVDDDTNGVEDIFVKNLNDGSVIRVSEDEEGGEVSADFNGGAAISGDGSLVAFVSDSADFVDSDTNGVEDVFVRSVASPESLRLISRATSGNSGNGDSGTPQFSDDGDLLVFVSTAPDLIVGDGNGQGDVFLADTETGSIERVSVDTGGGDANGPSFHGRISGDGRYVFFSSLASDLVASGEATFAVYRRDLVEGETILVSKNVAGGYPSDSTVLPSDAYAVSEDGNRVVFVSLANDLVAGIDPEGFQQLFLKDIAAESTTLISASLDGGPSAAAVLRGNISGDGQRVTFGSGDSGLVADDTNGSSDIYFWTEAPSSPPPAAAPDNSALRAALLRKFSKLKKKARAAKKKGKSAKAKKFKKKAKKVAKQLRAL